MKVLLVDDEAPARQRLAGLLGDLDASYEVVAEAANGEQALAAFANEPADLVLMDIRMPGMDGIQAALHLAQEPTPPAVIFTTAYDEHALKAFEANAVDYLLKPIRRERLATALQKARALSRPQLAAMRELSPERQFLSASYRGGVLRVPLDTVYYLRADSKYVVVRHEGGEALLEESLKSLEERFPDHLQRIHRNALVVPTRVAALNKTAEGHAELAFETIDDRLEVSRRHLPTVRQWLKES